MEVSAWVLQLTFKEFLEAVEKMRKAQQDCDGSPTNYNKRLKGLKEAKVDRYIKDITANGGLQASKPTVPNQIKINLE